MNKKMSEAELKYKINSIAEFYGPLSQICKAVEELGELSHALLKYLEMDLACDGGIKSEKGEAVTYNVCEEIADVEIMLLQLKHYGLFCGKEIAEIKEKKVRRQLERMKVAEW